MSWPLEEGIDWFRSDAPGSDFRCGRIEADFVAEWPGSLAVRVDSTGRLLRVHAPPGADPIRVEKLTLGAGRAFAQWLVGRPSLHAGAVAVCDAGLAIIGSSGAGKSTLVASMCDLPDVQLLSDDVLLLEPSDRGWLARPTEVRCYLEVGPGNAKTPVPVRAVAERSVALKAIVALTFDDTTDAISLRRLHGGDAFSTLSSAILRFGAGPQRWRPEFDGLVDLGQRVPSFELARPHGLDHVPAVARCLLSYLTESTPP